MVIEKRERRLESTDPTGLETVVLSASIPGSYVHLFIAQQDESNGEIHTLSLHPEGRVPAGLLSLIPDVAVPAEITLDFKGEIQAAESYYEDGVLPKGYEYQCTPEVPKGMNQNEYDSLVWELGNDYPTEERGYKALEGPNSNTYIDDVIESSGSIIPDILGAQAQNWGEDYSYSGGAH